MSEIYYTKQTPSTNKLMREILSQSHKDEGFVVYTDFQSDGKGHGNNKWESEPSKNLLFSLLFYPKHILASEQFILSQIVSIALVEILSEHCDNIKIKWPNDIYVNDKKIAGMLIENTLLGNSINRSIVGIGLNLNQLKFLSDAPNPVSLKQITGKSINRLSILKNITERINFYYKNFDYSKIGTLYFSKLYRNDGFYPFRTNDEVFMAKITEIATDGKMVLQLKDDSVREYGFKETEFVINP